MARIKEYLASWIDKGNVVIDFTTELDQEYRIEICPEEVLNYYESEQDFDMLERATNWAKNPQWVGLYAEVIYRFIGLCPERWQPLLELENAN